MFRRHEDVPPAIEVRPSTGIGHTASTGCPFRCARNGTMARTQPRDPQAQKFGQVVHGVLQETLLETTP